MLLGYVESKGVKNGYVMWPIRTATSGMQMTPAGATEIMEILGKEESIKRIKKGIELLQNAWSDTVQCLPVWSNHTRNGSYAGSGRTRLR